MSLTGGGGREEERTGKGDGSGEGRGKTEGKRNQSLWQAHQEVTMERSEHAGKCHFCQN